MSEERKKYVQQSQPMAVRWYLLSFLKQSEPTACRWCFLPSIPKTKSLFRVKKFFRQGLAVLVVLMLFLLPQGCLKDLPETLPTDYVWKPLFAFPIGEAEFGLKIPSGFDTRLLQTDTLTGFPRWTALEKIPMEGAVGFDFGRVLGNRDEINMAVLRLNAYNGFPVEVKIQAYLEDAFGNVLDSLFTPVMTIKRGKLSAGGETLQHAHTMEEVYFDQERLDLLLRVKWIVFRGELQNVIFFPQYTFSVQMGAVLGIITEF
jgi:hypothetical protein